MSRAERLHADFEALQALKSASNILDFEAVGDCPERYTIIFHGKGVNREASPHAEIVFTEQHRVDVRLPYSYPERPPDIRWLTPILHPNVSYSGFIDLADVGLPWNPSLGLDAICERLWDLARLAYVNPDKSTNYSAKNWYEKECQLPLPVDSRPLRDRPVAANKNVIRYLRKGQIRELLPSTSVSDVLYIGEDTPPPPLAPLSAAPPARAAFPPRRARRDGDDDVLYIGEQ